jgi:poly(A) polymerase
LTPRILDRSEHPISRRDIDPNVLKVLYRLTGAGHVAYLVGGSVRDLMLGRRPKDFDLATSAHPHQVRELFRNSRLIGRRFRLVHVFFGQQNIEVATFRRRSEDTVDEGELLIRHDNTFGTPEEDAFRRDFTVNALFYDIRNFQVIDYVGGVDDLRARTVRTIGEPEIRLREDPVRMIRALRLCARFDFTLEPATAAAIRDYRDELRKASMARLVEETYRTLGMAGAARALELMLQFGLLESLLPHLGEHLRSGPADSEPSRVLRNLAALERASSAGTVADHALLLAAL